MGAGQHGLSWLLPYPTVPSTTLVADIAPGDWSSAPQNLTILDSKLYFAAYSHDFEVGIQVWVHDPATTTTALVANIWQGIGSAIPTFLTPIDGKLYFAADDGRHGHELRVHNPTTASTTMVVDVYPGADARVTHLGLLGSQLYFNANDGQHGQELWTLTAAPRWNLMLPLIQINSMN